MELCWRPCRKEGENLEVNKLFRVMAIEVVLADRKRVWGAWGSRACADLEVSLRSS